MKVLGGGWQHSEKLKMMANNNAQIPTNVYISHFVSKKKKKDPTLFASAFSQLKKSVNYFQ